MDQLVVLKKQDLEELLQNVIDKAVACAKPERKKAMGVEEAVSYLNNEGFKITSNVIYQHTMKGTIPYRRFGGRKLVFLADELDEWVSDQLSGKPVVEKAAISARRKMV